jgi:MYXO-CTERM domain-containing protein
MPNAQGFRRRFIAGLIAVGAIVASVAPGPAAARGADARGTRLLHHERLGQIERAAFLGAEQGRERLAFDAFGRRFELDLEPNPRVAPALNSGASRPLVGRISGEPESWVRLTRVGRGWIGMIYDGEDLYALEPGADVAAMVGAGGDTDGTVMFRLADLEMDPSLASCGTVRVGERMTALQAVEAIGAEFATASSTAATKQLNVGMIGDVEFVARAGSTTNAESYIAARMNIVDGIFASQADVRINVSSIRLFTAEPDPFTTTDASALLDDLATFRMGDPAQRALGLTHLFTGRSLDGTTVGIAFIRGVCNARGGTSLTEARVGITSNTTVALIAAHEIGHNFGAPHDGEEACAATPPAVFLMAAQVNGSSTFSQCSLDQMRPLTTGASCLVNATFPDVELVSPVSSTRHGLDQNFSLTLTARSIGSVSTNGVVADFMIPPGVELNEINAAGGTCTSGAGAASCSIGTIPAGDNRTITLSLTGRQLGSRALTGTLTATNDAVPGNNSVTVTVNTERVIDLAATVAASPPSVNVGESVTATVRLRNLSTDTAPDARLSIDVPAGLSLGTVSGGGLPCTTPSASSVSCGPASLAGGAESTVTVTLNATQSGTRTITAVALSSAIDPDTANDSSQASITVIGPTNSSASSGSGGGGRVSLILLAALFVLALFAFRRRQLLKA